MIKYNFDKLKGKIKEVYSTQNEFSEAMNMAPNTLSSKLNNNTCFSSEEISLATELLGIEDPKEAWIIFFTKQVENISTK